ncbi:MAG: 3-isopropylmalate dehydratase small subunit [Pseudonocardia sp.]
MSPAPQADRLLVHVARAVPLRRSSVDTDQIIPSDYCKRIGRTGYADALFAEWRDDPEYFLAKPEHQGASILVAGADFGIGSSREHAVWALRDGGFRVVVAPSFGDIFSSNAAKNMMLTAVVSQEQVDRLWTLLEADPGLEITVDLAERRIHGGCFTADFQVPEAVRRKLMEGLDDISESLAHEDAITAHERGRPRWMPVTA